MADREDSLDELLRDVKDAIGPLDAGSDAGRDAVRAGASAASSSRRQDGGLPRGSADATAFPTEMNCSQVFNQLLKCYSLGGQIRNYYRYGELSYCQDKRRQLKFCLSTRVVGEEERKERIKTWYMTALAEQQAHGQSSEAVWRSRDVPLRRPFREDSEQYLGNSN